MSDERSAWWRRLDPAVFCFASVAVSVLALTGSWRYALGVALGPFAGGVARDWQSCCADNSLSLAPHAAAGVVLGALVRIVGRRRGVVMRRVGATAWGLGSLGWFLAAIVSYAHALE